LWKSGFAACVLALPLAAEAQAPRPPEAAAGREPPAVQVRVEDRTYPVQANAKSKWPPVLKPQGRDTYTTPAVVMENEYLRAAILPEFAGRLVEVIFKPKSADLFWRNDKLLDRGPGRMGGGQWSFPFWEHCRHFDEACGYAIVRHADGAATVAMDMRLDDYLKKEETARYGRATNLRLVQTVRLEPDRAVLDWSARVDNPLPIRYGFKLWWLLRQDAKAGVGVIMPAAAVGGHGAPQLHAWDRNAAIRFGLQDSLFAVGMKHDFAGWYLPEHDLNSLRLQDHRIAPGAKQVLYQPNPGGYIEMWGGNCEIFEECGRILPAFGAYENNLTLLPALGIGKADYANRHAAASCRRRDDGAGWDVRAVTTRNLQSATLSLEEWVRDRAATNAVTVPVERIGPTCVFETFLPRRGAFELESVLWDLDHVYAPPKTRLHDRNLLRVRENAPSAISGLRALAYDYSGKSGAPCLFAIVDKITGGQERWWQWTLDAAAFAVTKVHGNTFTIDYGDASLKATFIEPGDAKPEVRSEDFLVVAAASDKPAQRWPLKRVRAPGRSHFFVVGTIQRGAAPEVKVEGAGLDATVTVGGQTVRFVEDHIAIGQQGFRVARIGVGRSDCRQSDTVSRRASPSPLQVASCVFHPR
jgi:hypothetical protein